MIKLAFKREKIIKQAYKCTIILFIEFHHFPPFLLQTNQIHGQHPPHPPHYPHLLNPSNGSLQHSRFRCKARRLH